MNYTYANYQFSKIFGGTDLHGAAGTFAMQLTRHIEFSAYAGAFRAESTFIEEVPVDPAIAALLGVTSARRVSHTVNYMPNMAGRLSKTFSKGVASIGGGQTVNPGNGLFLTSYSRQVFAGYNYGGLRRWSLGVSASHATSRSVGNILGEYTQTTGSFGVSRQLGRMVNFVCDYSVRKHGSNDYDRYNRLIHAVAVGLAFSPGEIPLRVW